MALCEDEYGCLATSPPTQFRRETEAAIRKLPQPMESRSLGGIPQPRHPDPHEARRRAAAEAEARRLAREAYERRVAAQGDEGPCSCET